MTLAQDITRHYNGDWHGNYGAFPAPGHSKDDRGVTVKDTQDGDVVFNSFNGADWQELKAECRAIGLLPERESRPRSNDGPRETGHYEYVDGDGAVIYRTVRIEEPGKRKRFMAQRPNGRGGWINGMGDVPKVLYRLPDIKAAISKAALTDGGAPTIYLVEGERKADKLASWGLVATAVAFGCKGWRCAYADMIVGCTVIILPDNDDEGRGFADRAAKDIEAAGGNTRIIDLPDLPPKGDIIDWKGTADDLRALVEQVDQAEKQEAPDKASAQAVIKATPFQWRDPSTIPLRPWVYGRWFLRGNVTCVVAPGGVGKSTMLAGTALALATGRALLGKTIWDGPKRVWLWNLEDDLDELSRSIQAAAKHFEIGESDIGDRLFVDSAMEGAGLCTATEVGGDFRLLMPVYEALTAELIARKIDVLVVDPFVSSHEVDENANSKIDKVAKAWSRVANAANCVIVLVHHTNKAGAGEVTALSSRGAVALINAARSTLVLNRMDSDRAEALGIPDDERRRYFAVEDDKPNRAPAAKADWYRLASVDLGNGEMDGLIPGDSIGVAEPWTVPNPFDDVKPSHLLRIQRIIDAGEYRENPQAAYWAGKVVADILDLNVDKKSDKSRIRQLLAGWIDEGALKVEERADKKREIRKWIVVGRWLEHTFAAPETGWARQGTAAEQSECPTTTPHVSGVVGCGRSNGENLGAAKSECGSPDPDDVGDLNCHASNGGDGAAHEAAAPSLQNQFQQPAPTTERSNHDY